MVILGLTGSIGMGKSTAGQMLQRLGVTLYDADAAVHRLFVKGGAAVAPVGAVFPGVITNGAVDRTKLGKEVFGDAPALARLEAIVHPLVREAQLSFLRAGARRNLTTVALDIPLLFETGGERNCDASILISAPRYLQEARVMSRPGMTRARFEDILRRQMPDAEKRRRADYVVLSGLDKGRTLRQLRVIVAAMSQARGKNWPRRVTARSMRR
ncbi:MAG: dephospho-CoA kinase [Alphaproteobacteria bacterium]|nr:dephospho-CoA kinase [Alphaproteobacteria bacterium]